MLGVLLVGIVGMRVEVLKLGTTVGGEIQQASQLEGTNAALRSQVSALSESERIEQLAFKLGMVMPGPLDIHFVDATSARNVSNAITHITEPSPESFLSGLESERAQDGVVEQAASNTSAIGALTNGLTTGSAPSSTDLNGSTSGPGADTTDAVTSGPGSTQTDAGTAMGTTNGASSVTGSDQAGGATQSASDGSTSADAAGTTSPTDGAATTSPSTPTGTPGAATSSTGANGAASLAG